MNQSCNDCSNNNNANTKGLKDTSIGLVMV